MLTQEEAFNLIKKERIFLNNIKDYEIKMNNSNNFERENLIGIYKIRKYSALRDGNDKLSQQIEVLILNLENCLENNLKFVSILGKQYYGMFYLSKNWDKVIGYLEADVDDNREFLY
ncbi:enoyl-CoA hydratase [Chryseobacterium sp.]|uniref:enoyl-CoA hydratase n=1 Tax=Chryseobacterium sp. TaxID=1871047 RepID=UPI002FC58E89